MTLTPVAYTLLESWRLPFTFVFFAVVDSRPEETVHLIRSPLPQTFPGNAYLVPLSFSLGRRNSPQAASPNPVLSERESIPSTLPRDTTGKQFPSPRPFF